MNAKRIIPCLDIMNNRVVKGVNFGNLTDAGDAVECAVAYENEGADEITFLDITATLDNADTVAALVKKVAEKVFIPLTVGGGIRTVEDARKVLRAGADKVAVNSAAILRPQLLTELADAFGSQCVVLAIDAFKKDGKYIVKRSGGTLETSLEAISWAERGAGLGAGEILLTSIDCDGVRDGFELNLTRAVSRAVGVPVIASGGAGNMRHFLEAFVSGEADACLAASLFHFREMKISDLKEYLKDKGIPVR